MEISLSTTIVLLLILIVAIQLAALFYVYNTLKHIRTQQTKHRDFLLKVKHDLPILARKIDDLEKEIIFPPENELN